MKDQAIVKQIFDVLSSLPVSLEALPRMSSNAVLEAVSTCITLWRFIFIVSRKLGHPPSLLPPNSSATMSSVLKGSYRPSINGGTFIANTTYHATRPAITGKLINGMTSCH
jgi:hypothetical protein